MAADTLTGVVATGDTRPRSTSSSDRVPIYLVENMDEGPLKTELQSCSEGPFKKSDFSIGHRGACLQFPEHTKE